MKKRFGFATICLALSVVLGISGILLRGAPADPDQIFTHFQEVGVLLTFFWFVICALSWGDVILNEIIPSKLSLFAPLAVGSAFFALIGFFLGVSGCLEYAYSPWLFIFFQIGPIFQYLQSREQPIEAVDADLSEHSKGFNLTTALEFQGIAAISFVLWSRFVLATLPHGPSDPLLYHLLAPRLWTDAGVMALPRSFPIAYQATWWEMLNVLGNLLLGGPEGKGLIEVQLFGQYLHLIVGAGGCLLALAALFRNLRFWKGWIYLALLSSLLSSDLSVNSYLAKNDLGVMFWLLAGTCFLLNPFTFTLVEACLGGFFLGFAILAKMNSAFFAFCVFLAWLFIEFRRLERRQFIKRVFIVGLSCLIGMIPMGLRNWIETGTPIYPYLGSLIDPSLITPHFKKIGDAFPVIWHFSLNYWVEQAKWIIGDSVIHYFLFIAPLFSFFFKDRILRILALIGPVSILWLLSAQIFDPFIRWAGVALLLSGCFGVFIIAEILQRIPLRKNLKKWVEYPVYVILLGVLGNAALPHSLWPSRGNESPTFFIRNPKIHMGGDSKAWLRLNANYSTPIFSTGDDQLYYISNLPVSAVNEDPELGRRMEYISDPKVFVTELRSLGFRYALDTAHWQTRYWTNDAYLLDQALLPNPEAVVFAGYTSEVVDLQILEESMAHACISQRYGYPYEIFDST